MYQFQDSRNARVRYENGQLTIAKRVIKNHFQIELEYCGMFIDEHHY